MSIPPPATNRADTRRTATALLEWYVEAGIDVFLQDAPRDRFAETAGEAARRRGRAEAPPGAAAEISAPATPVLGHSPSPSAAPPAAPVAPPPTLPVDDDAAAADARERAKAAKTLDELAEALRDFTGCGLKQTARSLVFADGDPNAELMLVGEAPGREEDLAGLPFVGRAGQFLNRMLSAIAFDRPAVRITNTVPWRPPGNRTPTPAETEICLPFLVRHIELVRPKVLVCLGSPATKALMGSNEGILRLRGRWSEFEIEGGAARIPITATLHPAYLLRQPSQKRLAWRDLLAVKARLES